MQQRSNTSIELECVVQINVQLSQLPDGSLCGILTGTADTAIATAASTAALMLVGGWKVAVNWQAEIVLT